MKNIVILLSAMLFMVACEKGNEEMKEAKVVVSVYDENGKIATGVPVKMYNEKDYKVFEKDNLTLPTAIIQTNESGMATFVLPREEWFATQSQRFLTFVVQEGGGHPGDGRPAKFLFWYQAPFCATGATFPSSWMSRRTFRGHLATQVPQEVHLV